jgi:hypothetical protein
MAFSWFSFHGWFCVSALDATTEVTCIAYSTLDCSTFGNGHLLNGSNNGNGLVGSLLSKLG